MRPSRILPSIADAPQNPQSTRARPPHRLLPRYPVLRRAPRPPRSLPPPPISEPNSYCLSSEDLEFENSGFLSVRTFPPRKKAKSLAATIDSSCHLTWQALVGSPFQNQLSLSLQPDLPSDATLAAARNRIVDMSCPTAVVSRQ